TGQGHNNIDKVIVMGVLERGDKGTSKVRTQVIPDRRRETLHPIVKENVTAGTALYSDELWGYTRLENDYDHRVIDHTIEYVKGRVHTNGMENFWSLLKRGLSGTYVSVEPFHMFRYLDEQAFRFNNRGHCKEPIHDGQRFDMTLRNIIGKRVMYKEL